jgi:hypothetical protein
MAAEIATLARTLNLVESVGQAKAALRAGLAEAEYGVLISEDLSWLSSPTTDEAKSTLAIDQAQLSGELGLLGSFDDGSPVDPTTWARQRRAVERVYIDVSGIEGVTGALRRVSFIDTLGQAIADAPRVFGEAAGKVLEGAGQAVGGLGSGFFSGLGVLGTLVLIAILLVALRGRIA